MSSVESPTQKRMLTEKIHTFRQIFQYGPRTIRWIWHAQPGLTLLFGACTVLAGILPGGIAYVGKWIVDAVLWSQKHPEDATRIFVPLGLEIVLITALMACQRGLAYLRSILHARIGHEINVSILEKAIELELTHFEDAEFYDKMTRARREASRRPLGLFERVFGLIQNALSLTTYGILLFQFSLWIAPMLLLGALPAFFAETYFSRQSFRLFRWRVHEARQQNYLEMVLARDDFAKEVQLLQSGPFFLERYRALFQKLFAEDRKLARDRNLWGFGLNILSSLMFYAAYGWIAWSTVLGQISLGTMTMYILLFKQGQSAIAASLKSVGGMYEDNLYL
ncbi:MAG: ABC transporter ATP-binding protein, partial [Myxococcota bacterium]